MSDTWHFKFNFEGYLILSELNWRKETLAYKAKVKRYICNLPCTDFPLLSPRFVISKMNMENLMYTSYTLTLYETRDENMLLRREF